MTENLKHFLRTVQRKENKEFLSGGLIHNR